MKKNDYLEKTIDEFAEKIIAKIETIQQDWKKPWFAENALRPAKNLNGRYYNGINQMILMWRAEEKEYKLPIWATFDRLKSLNMKKNADGTFSENKELPSVNINKGEKPTSVFITLHKAFNPKTKESISLEEYNNLQDDDKKEWCIITRTKCYNVFNIAQTNLKEARPELYKKFEESYTGNPTSDVSEYFTFAEVDEMIQYDKWICPIKQVYGDDAYYSISKNEIVVPEKKQFKNGESFYSNLFHEMTHSTGSEKCLNRLKPANFGSKEYAKEELVAELTAAVTSARYGIAKTVKEDSIPYLKSWLKSLKETPDFLKTVLKDVKKAHQKIVEYVGEEKAGKVLENVA